MSHVNNGACEKCAEIFEAYPGFDNSLRSWFIMMQAKFITFHISCAGRGRIDQSACYFKGASHARWGQSAHNFNAAIDCFFLVGGTYNLDRLLFEQVEPEIPEFIEWYGAKGASFPELPHYELKDWHLKVAHGELKIVE